MNLLLGAIGACSVLFVSNGQFLRPDDGALSRPFAASNATGFVPASVDKSATSPRQSDSTVAEERIEPLPLLESFTKSFKDFFPHLNDKPTELHQLDSWLTSTMRARARFSQADKDAYNEMVSNVLLIHFEKSTEAHELAAVLLKSSDSNTKKVTLQVLMRRLSDDNGNDNVCKIIAKNPDAFFGALKQVKFDLDDRQRVLANLLPSVSKWMPEEFRPLPSDFFEEEVLPYNVLHYVETYSILSKEELNEWFLEPVAGAVPGEIVEKLHGTFVNDLLNLERFSKDKLEPHLYLNKLISENTDQILDPETLLQWLRYYNLYWKELLEKASGDTAQDIAIREQVLRVLNEVKTDPPGQDLVESLRRILDMQAFVDMVSSKPVGNKDAVTEALHKA
ncbi:hypothetical protein CCR75_005595 [Bremia lactucae]|uniref:Secreted RxLR effector n=1 Tax=Bremia lactucae TaxID=4779 RepID=A0A976NZT9_BRELC|nr:hypothetical protein CCR75_003860 [Bremia lactucae]TDH74076.1 hypothetical protein CCR75_005595 [Bremia lactucae]